MNALCRAWGRLKTPPLRGLASLRDLPAGTWVRVQGRIVLRDPVASPLGDESCAYYRTWVERWRPPTVRAFGGDGMWEPVEHEEDMVPFELADGATRVLVESEHARVTLPAPHKNRSIPHDEPDIRAVESVLLAGDLVEVSGRVALAMDVTNPERSFRESPARITLGGSRGRPLRIALLERDDTPR